MRYRTSIDTCWRTFFLPIEHCVLSVMGALCGPLWGYSWTKRRGGPGLSFLLGLGQVDFDL